MQQQYVITFAGADRTGLVETLADLVKVHGGDWQRSELARLDGAFAGAILVHLSTEGFTTLKYAIKDTGTADLVVQITPSVSQPQLEPNLHLSLTDPNRPGIVYEITHELAELEVNILHFTSRVESAAWSGEPLFMAHIEAYAPAHLEVDALRERLDVIEDKMTLEIDIESR